MDMHLYICTYMYTFPIDHLCIHVKYIHTFMTLYICNSVCVCETRCVCTNGTSMHGHMNTYSNICMFMCVHGNLLLTSHPGGLYWLSGLVRELPVLHQHPPHHP